MSNGEEYVNENDNERSSTAIFFTKEAKEGVLGDESSYFLVVSLVL